MRNRSHSFVMVAVLATVSLAAGSPTATAQPAASHLYFFTNDGCAPCRQVEPAIEALDREGYPVTTVNISQRPDWADKFQVDRTPTVVLVTGDRMTGRHAGLIDLPTLKQWFAAVGQPPNQPNARDSLTQQDTAPAEKVGSKVVVNQRNQPRPLTMDEAVTDARSSSEATFTSNTLHKGTSVPGDRAEARALAATVRLKVEDPEGISYATGTVIHAQDNEALVLTCGHVFRDANGRGKISAEYGFGDGRTETVPGELIHYDADARDVALVSIRSRTPLTAVPLAMENSTIQRRDRAFSVGCDHGDNPTIRRTAIKNRATYDGQLKYDIYGRPVDGRSGGGLFTAEGELIGVCNAAAVEVDEGIYSALETIHWELAHTRLDHLFTPKARSDREASARGQDRFASNDFARDDFAGQLSEQRSRPMTRIQPRRQLAVDRSGSRPKETLVGLQTDRSNFDRQRSGMSDNSDAEVVILVRSKSNPQLTEAITIADPSPQLLEYLGQLKPTDRDSRLLNVARYRQ